MEISKIMDFELVILKRTTMFELMETSKTDNLMVLLRVDIQTRIHLREILRTVILLALSKCSVINTRYIDVFTGIKVNGSLNTTDHYLFGKHRKLTLELLQNTSSMSIIRRLS